MMPLLQPLRLRLGCLLLGWGERLLDGAVAGMAEARPALPGSLVRNPVQHGRPDDDPAGGPPPVSPLENDNAPLPTPEAGPIHEPPQLEPKARGAKAVARPTDPTRDPAVNRRSHHSSPSAEGSQTADQAADQADGTPLTPALRRPISIEKAVLNHDLRVLRREAADALAALGAAHALVSSARLAQVQDLRQQIGEGRVSEDALLSMAADYQGWVNDQVRLFDALSLVMRMRVPAGRVLDQVDPSMRPQACHHLEMLCLEYERQQLSQRFPRESSTDKDPQG